MQIAIVGLAGSGKTTVFNTLTRGHAETGGYGALTLNVGVVKVPDERLEGNVRGVPIRQPGPPRIVPYQPVPGAQGRFRDQRVLVVEQHQVVRLLKNARHVDRDRLVELQGIGRPPEVVVGEEERKIRTNPAARGTDLLKDVFGR